MNIFSFIDLSFILSGLFLLPILAWPRCPTYCGRCGKEIGTFFILSENIYCQECKVLLTPEEKEKKMNHKKQKKNPKVGDEIWLPGGKHKVLAVKKDWASAAILHKKVYWVLVEKSGLYGGDSWYEWEDNIDKFQEYFKKVFERRACRKCQFPLPWDKCEVHI